MTARVRRAGVLLAAAATLLVPLGGRPAAGESVHRAAVVVDLGNDVRTARVTFTSESISGIEALQLAGFAPVVRAYGGNGGAVCAICDHGCPADSTCLTCGGADYWAYFRAPSGAGSYTYWPSGAGSTRVHDGDVEAWKWGKGTAPRFVSFAEVWGEPATTTTASPPPTVASPPPPTVAADGPATTVAPNAPAVAAGGGPSPSAGAAPAADVDSRGDADAPAGAPSGARAGPTATSTTLTPPTTPESRRTAPATTSGPPPGGGGSGGSGGDRVAVAPELTSGSRGGGGSVTGLIAFGALAAGLGYWIAVAHRRRARLRSTADPR